MRQTKGSGLRMGSQSAPASAQCSMQRMATAGRPRRALMQARLPRSGCCGLGRALARGSRPRSSHSRGMTGMTPTSTSPSAQTKAGAAGAVSLSLIRPHALLLCSLVCAPAATDSHQQPCLLGPDAEMVKVECHLTRISQKSVYRAPSRSTRQVTDSAKSKAAALATAKPSKPPPGYVVCPSCTAQIRESILNEHLDK